MLHGLLVSPYLSDASGSITPFRAELLLLLEIEMYKGGLGSQLSLASLSPSPPHPEHGVTTTECFFVSPLLSSATHLLHKLLPLMSCKTHSCLLGLEPLQDCFISNVLPFSFTGIILPPSQVLLKFAVFPFLS